VGEKEQQELELYTNDRAWLSFGLLLAGIAGWVGIYYAVELCRWAWRTWL